MSAPNETPVTQARTDPALPLENERHEYFAQQCVLHTRAEAARRCGYSVKSARRIAWELHQYPAIRARIEFLRAAAFEDAGVDAHAILRELAAVARSNIAHYHVDDEGFVTLGRGAPRDAMRAIARVKRKRREIRHGEFRVDVEYETEIWLWDKNTAITNAMKHLGLLKESVKHEVTGKGGAPIEHAHTVTVRFVRPEPKSHDGNS